MSACMPLIFLLTLGFQYLWSIENMFACLFVFFLDYLCYIFLIFSIKNAFIVYIKTFLFWFPNKLKLKL